VRSEVSPKAWDAQPAPSRSGIELIQATKVFAHEQRGRSWWHLSSTIAVLLGTVISTIFSAPWPLRVGLSSLAGLALIRMFIFYHDYYHGTLLQKSAITKLIMLGFGVITMNPPSAWKRSHNHHHRSNARIFGSHIGSFPVLTTEAYAAAPKRQRVSYALSRHPLTILLGYWSIFFYGMCLKPFITEPRKHPDCGVALVLQGATVVTLALFAPAILLFSYVLPLGMASALGAYLFYSQHNFPGMKLHERADWSFSHAALHSSSFTAMGPVLQWFTGNIGYHHVHHLNAHIPFYRLPEAMSSIRELQAARPIRLSPRDIYRCFRLKLWDPKMDRMVSFRGVA
jgi:omega-6 fatty acid desaturase (delta-12 desaturase)